MRGTIASGILFCFVLLDGSVIVGCVSSVFCTSLVSGSGGLLGGLFDGFVGWLTEVATGSASQQIGSGVGIFCFVLVSVVVARLVASVGRFVLVADEVLRWFVLLVVLSSEFGC